MAQSQSARLGGSITAEKAVVFPEDLISPLLSDNEEIQHVKRSSSLQRHRRANTESTTRGDLNDGGSPSVDSILDDEGKPKLTPMQIIKHMTVVMAAVGGAAAFLATFAVSPAIIVYAAGGICILNTPMVVYKEHKISTIPTLRKSIQIMRQLANKLADRIDSLEREIDVLQIEAGRFDEVNEELSAISKKQGYNVDSIVKLVNENEEILDAMKGNVRQKVLQDVISIVVRSYRNNDMTIDRVEAKLLALKISVKLEVYGIVFDEEKFLHAVSLKPSLHGIISIVKKLLPRENGEGAVEEFVCDEDSDDDDIYDMFYMSSEDQKRRGSVQAVRAEFQCTRRVSLCKNISGISRRKLSAINAPSEDDD